MTFFLINYIINSICSDHSDDCGDLSDELGCHFTSTCSEVTLGGCEQSCTNITSGGYICSCYQGYIIDATNKKKCLDIDECATGTSMCSQVCTNINGTYSCACVNGFKLVDGTTGICKAEKEETTVIFTTGTNIRAFNLKENKEFEVIASEKRIESIDYDPKKQMVFWADSSDRTIKRSYMVNAMEGQAKIGFAQDLNMKGNSKPTAVAVDWIADNLYWTETDRTGSKPRGRIMVAKTDGRYRRALVNNGLEIPTSIAVDPQLGRLYWSDAGSAPKIEVSWMDGGRRKPLIVDGIRHPAGVIVDYDQEHRIYWVDTKLNTIESIKPDGTMRKVVIRGEQLKHPISLDVFESSLYWVSRDTGDLIKQDKFGRGVQVVVQRDIANPAGVKIYHENRYNTSLKNPCFKSTCSHLCLLVPGGWRCACPDNSVQPQNHRSTAEVICDAGM